MDIELLKSIFDELIFSPHSDEIKSYKLEWGRRAFFTDVCNPYSFESKVVDCLFIDVIFNVSDTNECRNNIFMLLKMLSIEYYIFEVRVISYP